MAANCLPGRKAFSSTILNRRANSLRAEKIAELGRCVDKGLPLTLIVDRWENVQKKHILGVIPQHSDTWMTIEAENGNTIEADVHDGLSVARSLEKLLGFLQHTYPSIMP